MTEAEIQTATERLRELFPWIAGDGRVETAQKAVLSDLQARYPGEDINVTTPDGTTRVLEPFTEDEWDIIVNG